MFGIQSNNGQGRSRVLGAIAAFLLAACGGGGDGTGDRGETAGAGADPPIQIVATVGVLCDLAEQVAGDRATVTCAIPPGQDPHHYAPKPSDRQAFEAASVVLYGGYGLDLTLQKLVDASPAPHKIPVIERAVPEPLAGGAHDHDHDHDHDHGNENQAPGASPGAAQEPEGDPHVWHDAALGAALAETIAAALGEAHPPAAAEWRDRGAALAQELRVIDGWIRQQVATIPEGDRKLVTVHDAFRYLARAYGLEVVGSLGAVAPAGRASAQDLRTLVDRLRQEQVPVLFAETTSDRQGIEGLGREAGIPVATTALLVEGPGGADSDVPTYQAMLVANTCAIAEGLGGRCDRAGAPLATPQKP
ncbi:MAG: metal ABC transporter substrate-binding protein [Cyanophyceae cyanobacterium]